MRGCLFVLVLAAAFSLAAAWFGAPALAAVLVEGGLAASGFEGRGTTVSVEADPPLEILAGHADRVVIGTNDGRFGDLSATRVDLTLIDVDLVGRSFAEVDGTFQGVRIDGADVAVPLRTLRLSGRAAAADAVVSVDGADVEAFATAAINAQLALPVAAVHIAEPDLLRVSAVGQQLDGRLVVEPDGSLAVALPLPGSPRLLLLEPQQLAFRSVTVLDGALLLTGTLDVAALVGT